ncbi:MULTISPECIES: DUF3142 domain-containing protein [unclassified Shewanella]|uniref:DUF3142 domain-containing protein n=1 Tax=Shewanella TaxID=22 RepID=UPI0021DA6642|nr:MULTISPECIES: DUF3142 domain-containing protein [unclassified Shewanella]MCU8020605.1 DUF3142 domain-containing protein [Shewanella sp. SM78]MCU8043034.1 DUF3142 domain-containing protein [Shewanella sp. SM68]MCU8047408.1 DUF3142 domain-containing protein [Shewanella sp. SM65]MCU8077914.1 DUF3142 domain-containing protein [Shewanella sp. SM103]
MGIGNLVKNISRNQWFLFALLSAAVFMSACQPASNPNETTASPNTSVAVKAATEATTLRAPLAQEVYIWQRQWRPANQTALVQSQGAFQGLRILALQAHPKPNGADIWFEVAVNHAWLQADPRPKIAVIRLDGQFAHLNDEQVINKINQVLATWQAKGTHIAGVEIDHDSANSKLPAYRDFLKKLKAQLPAELKLSITALPAWLSSADFPVLLTSIDELVLQIHSVSDPRLGLFDATQGWQWVQQLSNISTVPYLIALPAYGSAVISTASGYQVESETPLRDQLKSVNVVQELMADPLVLQAFVQKLHTQKDAKLRGIIWFRLPLEGDKRVWPLNTLIAVAQQGELAAKIELVISSDNKATTQTILAAENKPKNLEIHKQQLFQLSLMNHGNIAGEIPPILSLAGQACSGYDAQNGYSVIQKDGLLTWQWRAENTAALTPTKTVSRTAIMPMPQSNRDIQTHMLNPGGQKVIGWARCESLYLQGIYAP